MGDKQPAWLTEKAQLLVQLLATRHDMHVAEETAAADILDHVDLAAELMGVSRQSFVKTYLSDDMISDQADRIAIEVNRQRAAGTADPRHLRVVPPTDPDQA